MHCLFFCFADIAFQCASVRLPDTNGFCDVGYVHGADLSQQFSEMATGNFLKSTERAFHVCRVASDRGAGWTQTKKKIKIFINIMSGKQFLD